ncbi:uncharacterized protein LOC131847309 [Achroia grisella]|uniref:uncharacterized protein LOC131847309 n=1 Tax=Achroia grisella TaxID=688607 RepID=UPI0027D231B6|nr:uncharacterized protein LOC131847309 [Achroia grisella]
MLGACSTLVTGRPSIAVPQGLAHKIHTTSYYSNPQQPPVRGHVDCSTQFFVLLQPAPWMAHKYVAFGQLIDGEETLQKIENVPTWYESPTQDIIIYQSGILNMECQDITINKGTKEYIHGHIDDLVTVGKLFYEVLIEKVFLEIEFRFIANEKMVAEGEDAQEVTETVRATERFNRKKEDIEKQIEKSELDNRGASVASEPYNGDAVEMYEYEPEEYSYQHVSLGHTASIEVNPEKPYYFPLTDVPYPGEVDSTYDLKKFLKGDYCLETDIEDNAPKKLAPQKRISYPSEIFNVLNDSESASSESLDSDEEKDLNKYLKLNMDRVSFAGGIIKGIARGAAQYNIFETHRKSELITDEELRKFRLMSLDLRSRDTHEKKVSISVPSTDTGIHQKIKRRQTGFVRPQDLEKIHLINKSEEITPEEDELVTRKVRIAPSSDTNATPRPARRPTGFVRAVDIIDSDTQVQRPSVLQRLYDNVSLIDNHGPTLKDYRPISESRQKSILLTYSPNSRIKNDDSREKYLRHSITIEDDSIEQVLNLQHGQKVARKISSDYVKTIDQMEHKLETSIRSIEYAKTRPVMSVTEYQLKNQRYNEGVRTSRVQVKTVRTSDEGLPIGGLRLPGDTPIYSLSDD